MTDDTNPIGAVLDSGAEQHTMGSRSAFLRARREAEAEARSEIAEARRDEVEAEAEAQEAEAETREAEAFQREMLDKAERDYQRHRA